MLTEAQKLDAYREAQQLLRLNEKWQHLMPGERKPNFRRAAREIVRRALGHKVERNQNPLQLHEGLMHEHDPREAALLERTLKNGHHDPRILHSFHTGVTKRPQPKRPIVEPDMDVDVYLHDHGDMIDYPFTLWTRHGCVSQLCARTWNSHSCKRCSTESAVANWLRSCTLKKNESFKICKFTRLCTI